MLLVPYLCVLPQSLQPRHLSPLDRDKDTVQQALRSCVAALLHSLDQARSLPGPRWGRSYCVGLPERVGPLTVVSSAMPGKVLVAMSAEGLQDSHSWCDTMGWSP